MVTLSEHEVETLSVAIGGSLKVTLEDLVDVTDWSLLEVTLGESLATYTRRTNSLYFKGTAEGETVVTIGYDGSLVKSFKLTVTV